MYVFLRQVDVSTTENQLSRFAEAVLDQKLKLPFTESPRMLSAEVMEIKDDSGHTQRHGLVCIQPEKAARWFIKEAHKYELNHKAVHAREYVTRKRNRVTNSDLERRRRNLTITRVRSDKPSFLTAGVDAFRREYSF